MSGRRGSRLRQAIADGRYSFDSGKAAGRRPPFTTPSRLPKCDPWNTNRFCNGPCVVNPFLTRILSPGSCFCPGSARSRHPMGFEEDRSANLKCVVYAIRDSCGLTWSIVPASGPPLRRLVC